MSPTAFIGATTHKLAKIKISVLKNFTFIPRTPANSLS